ncbi:MAG: protein kinase [Clostridia bacterium]|nr:protein kinase [Clostridia bacterium]
MNINGYTLIGELNNENSGFSKWGFAVKDGKEYFIKELITPVYPVDRSVMSEELFASKRNFCKNFEDRYVNLYSAINNASCGNLVRIEEFFRCGSKYYLINEKVSGEIIPVDRVVFLSESDKLLLAKSVVYAFCCLHRWGIVHFDVKPTNILVKKTRGGKYVGKVIDFDAGFSQNEVRDDVELGGDLTYLAPETFLAIRGDDVKIGEKADIYSLGLVLHEYFSGRLPTFDRKEYEYPFEAILDGGGVSIDKTSMPNEIADVIIKMIDADPDSRPSADDVLRTLKTLAGDTEITVPPINNPEYAPVHTGGSRLIINMKTSPRPVDGIEISAPLSTDSARSTPTVSAPSSEWFSSAGDL